MSEKLYDFIFEDEIIKTLKEVKDAVSEEEPKDEKTIKSIEEFINELVSKTNIPEKILRKILLQMQAALWKSDYSETAFVEKYSVKYEKLLSYTGLVDFLRDVKAQLKRDGETEAFTALNDLWKSQIGVLGSQIYRTYFSNQDKLSDIQKVMRSIFAAASFVHNMTGIVLENLRVIEKIADFLDENKDIINLYIAEQQYQKEEDDTNKDVNIQDQAKTEKIENSIKTYSIKLPKKKTLNSDLFEYFEFLL